MTRCIHLSKWRLILLLSLLMVGLSVHAGNSNSALPTIISLLFDDDESPVIQVRLQASRTHCFSPCTVVFSATETLDSSTPNEHERFRDLGYYFNFNDASSGDFATTGLSKNSQQGGPMAAHTFICQPDHPQYESGVCEFAVAVSARNALGDTGTAQILITVDSPEHAFSEQDTICISTSGNYGGDMACPVNAERRTSMLAMGEFSGKRVLLRRGESFAEICVNYSERNILIEPFGNTADGRPVIEGSMYLGVDNCGDYLPENNAEIANYGQTWTTNVTVTGLRVPDVGYGMSYSQVGVHDLDMNYYDESSGGTFAIASNGDRCLNDVDLDCENIPLPVGAYISETEIVGSESGVLSVGVNIGGFNCPVINWIGFVGNTVWNANEHNFRIEGFWRGVWSHNVMRGHHHNSGRKHTITLRSCGFDNIDPAVAVMRHNVPQNTAGAPYSRYAVVADNILGSADSTQASWKLQIAPSNASSVETIVDAIAERNTFIDSTISPSIDMALNGYYLTARVNQIYTPSGQNCIIVGPNLNPLWGENECSGAVPDVFIYEP